MKRRGRALRRRYGRADGGDEVARVEALLRARGYKKPAEHARSFVSHGYDAAQLLHTEVKYGKFPVSSPMGPLARKRTHPRYG